MDRRGHINPVSAGKRGFVCIAACLFSVPALVLAAVGLFSVVSPLHEKLLVREARALADEIDSVIKERSAVLEVVVGNLSAGAPLNGKEGERLVKGLRSAVPDFLSLEVIDGQGAIIAMLGDLDLPEAGRLTQAEKPMHKAFADQPHRNLFRDDPGSGFFAINCKHRRADGATSFTRARFSREPIERAMTSSSTAGSGQLVSISGKSSAWPTDTIASVRIHHKWWGFPAAAEALLLTPNWMVRLEEASAKRVLLCFVVMVVAVMMYAVVAATWLPRLHRAWYHDSDKQPRSAYQAIRPVEPDPQAHGKTSLPRDRADAPAPAVKAAEPLSDIPEWLDVTWSERDVDDLSGKQPAKSSIGHSRFSNA